jgi:biopolymer transport protein ExbD
MNGELSIFMKIEIHPRKRPRIEMIPLIDIVFLLLVFFIYTMLSMAVHRALPVVLPASSTADIDKRLTLSVTIEADGTVFLDKEPVPLENLSGAITKAKGEKDAGVLLFADRRLSYQQLFKVLDQIRLGGIHRISLQAEADRSS